MWSNNSNPGHITMKIKNVHPCKDYTWIFTAVLFIRAQNLKQSKCPSTGVWINKCGIFHTMEYYWAIKRNEVAMHATTKMNFKKPMLSEGNHMIKATYGLTSFIINVLKGISLARKQILGYLELGVDIGTEWNEQEESFWSDKNIL